jgi:Zn-dependent protease/CBS domain-containing protein
MSMRGSFTLLRVKGVPIRLHWTLLLILPYVAFVFSRDFAGVADAASVGAEGLSLPPLFWGALLALALFASVAVHELAHSLVAIRVGGRVRAITLMLIGGVSQIERLPRRKGIEALMAAAGPAVSLALGALFLFGRGLLPADAGDLRLGFFYLGQINLILGFFNLLPAFPMDGGRVLRDLLATRMGALRATRVAALVGKVLAVFMGLFGLWTGNLFLLLVAIFVFGGAVQEARMEETRDALDGLRVADVMRPRPLAVSPETPVTDLPKLMRKAGRMEAVVVDDCAQPLGLVQASDLARLSAAERTHAAVSDLGDHVARAAVQVSKEESAADALDRADDAGVEYLIAIDEASPGGVPTVVGLLERREIEKALFLCSLEEERVEDRATSITQRETTRWSGRDTARDDRRNTGRFVRRDTPRVSGPGTQRKTPSTAHS